MKHQNGLRIYGIYIFDKYPDWTILLTNLDTTDRGEEYIEGLAFDSDGKFDIGVSLTLPMNYKTIGYLLGYSHRLHLDKLPEKEPEKKEYYFSVDDDWNDLERCNSRTSP